MPPVSTLPPTVTEIGGVETSAASAGRPGEKRHGLGNWSFVLMPLSLLLVDFAAGAIYGRLSEDISVTQFWVMSYVALILLGMGWAAAVFKRKYWEEILVTVLALFLIRLVSSMSLAPEYLSSVLVNTLTELFAFVVSLTAFCVLYGLSERRLRFGYAKDIVSGLTNPKTKLNYAAGRCSNCDEEVIVSIQRSRSMMSGIFGESRLYLCPKCGVYIGGNPAVSLFMGTVEAGACVLFMMFFAAIHGSGRWGPESYVVLGFLIGVFDGLKRSLMGVVGLVKAFRARRVLSGS